MATTTRNVESIPQPIPDPGALVGDKVRTRLITRSGDELPRSQGIEKLYII